MNVSAAEFVLNNIDELLEKACINEKGQKTLIKQLASERREEVINECSDAAALKAILNQTFLATPEGRRLARELIQKLGISIVWKNIKINIKDDSTTKRYCFYLGQTLIMLWKKFEKGELELEPSETSLEMERTIFEELFQLAVCTSRKFSEKFLNIIHGVADGKNASISQMLYRTSNHVLWQALDAPNMQCRYNAAMVFLTLYPLDVARDDNPEYDLRTKQHDVIKQLLKDDSYHIRVVTVKAVLKYLSLYWPVIKPYQRKDYLTIIIDELAHDETTEVRLAVYEALPLLFSCSSSLTVLEHALNLVILPGLNDPKEKVRLAVANLLLKLEKHPISIPDIISLEELMACLDVENCDEIEIALTKIMFPIVCCQETTSIENRFHKIEAACKASRIGALKFHSIIGLKKFITNEQATLHIQALILGTMSRIKPPVEGNETNNSMMSTNETRMDLNETQGGLDFTLVKTLFDSAVVLFLSCRNRLTEDSNHVLAAKINKLFGKAIPRLLGERYKNTILGESALVAATFFPQNIFPNSRSFTADLLNKDYDDETLTYYVLTFASWDMNYLISFVEKELTALAKKFKLEKKILPKNRINNTSSVNIPADSSKDRGRKPLEILAIILSSPPMNQHFIQGSSIFAKRFHGILKCFVEHMPSLIENEQEQLWRRIYDVYSMLTICIKNNENDRENCDTFEKELQWFYQKFNAKELTPEFVLLFINLAKYHFECNQQKESSCESVVTLCKHISSFAESSELAYEFKLKINALQKAALEAFMYAKKDVDLAIIEEEEEPTQEATFQGEERQESRAMEVE